MPRARQAFTLIELLTVIGIIAVLAALLFPVFATARGKAREITCVSNLRQIGMAIKMYTQDHDELYPWAVDPTDKYTPEIWSQFPEFQAKRFDAIRGRQVRMEKGLVTSDHESIETRLHLRQFGQKVLFPGDRHLGMAHRLGGFGQMPDRPIRSNAA